MFSLIVEINDYQVAGFPCAELPDVRARIERTLRDRGRMPAKDDFDRLMEAMTRTLESASRWQYEARRVSIIVRRYERTAGIRSTPSDQH